MRQLITMCLLLAACENYAPPIRSGKCVVSRYVGAVATNQTCLYQGYTYVCVDDTCNNVGEAVAERPKGQ